MFTAGALTGALILAKLVGAVIDIGVHYIKVTISKRNGAYGNGKNDQARSI